MNWFKIFCVLGLLILSSMHPIMQWTPHISIHPKWLSLTFEITAEILTWKPTEGYSLLDSSFPWWFIVWKYFLKLCESPRERRVGDLNSIFRVGPLRIIYILSKRSIFLTDWENKIDSHEDFLNHNVTKSIRRFDLRLVNNQVEVDESQRGTKYFYM